MKIGRLHQTGSAVKTQLGDGAKIFAGTGKNLTNPAKHGIIVLKIIVIIITLYEGGAPLQLLSGIADGCQPV